MAYKSVFDEGEELAADQPAAVSAPPAAPEPPVSAGYKSVFDTVEATPAAPTTPERTLAGTAKDIGLTAVKAVVGVPQAAVGVVDLATSLAGAGPVLGNLAERAGVKFGETADILSDLASPAQKAARERVSSGFETSLWEGAKAAVTNPSVVAESIGESIPAIYAGGAAGRAVGLGSEALGLLAKGATKSGKAGTVLGALGEGIMQAGQGTEQIRETTGDVTPGQAGLMLASGAATSAISGLSGRLAAKLGIADIDTLAAGGVVTAAQKTGLVRRTVEGMVTEGLLEELPQSVVQQVIQNKAENKPLWEGVDEAAVMGFLAGTVMGGTISAFHPSRPASAGLDSTATSALSEAFPGFDVRVVNGQAVVTNAAGDTVSTDVVRLAQEIVSAQSEGRPTEDIASRLFPAKEVPPAAAAPITAAAPADDTVTAGGALPQTDQQLADAFGISAAPEAAPTLEATYGRLVADQHTSLLSQRDNLLAAADRAEAQGIPADEIQGMRDKAAEYDTRATTLLETANAAQQEVQPGQEYPGAPAQVQEDGVDRNLAPEVPPGSAEAGGGDRTGAAQEGQEVAPVEPHPMQVKVEGVNWPTKAAANRAVARAAKAGADMSQHSAIPETVGGKEVWKVAIPTAQQLAAYLTKQAETPISPAALAQMRKEAVAEVNANPVYEHLAALRKAGLSRGAAETDYSLAGAPKGVFTKAGVNSVDDIATELGYQDGQTMLAALENVPSKSEAVKAAVEAKKAEWAAANSAAAEAAQRETITPAEDTLVGANSAGESLYERADGSRYRIRTDRKDRPSGYPDFGGDLAEASVADLPEAPFSVGEPTGNTVAKVSAELRRFLGKAFERNVASGRLAIVQSMNELPENILKFLKSGTGDVQAIYSKNATVAGAYDPTTKMIYLVADSVSAGEAVDVYKHEVVHRLMREDGVFMAKHDQLLGDLAKLRTTDKAVEAAFAHAEAVGTPAGLVNEEAASYLVQNGEYRKLGVFQKIIANIRAWLVAHGFNVKQFTKGDILAMVEMGIGRDTTRSPEGFTRGQREALRSAGYMLPSTKRMVGWSTRRIGKLLSAYGKGTRNETKGFAVLLTPDQFLSLTAGTEDLRKIAAGSKPLDTTKLADEIREIYLDVSRAGGNQLTVNSSQGRRRMLALKNAGITNGVPVVLNFGEWVENPGAVAGAVLTPKTLIQGMRPVKVDSEIVPISAQFQTRISQLFGPSRAGSMQGDIQFSKGQSDVELKAVDTESPEFKRWFGKSKVVDAEGKPLRVFHGTTKEFSEFIAHVRKGEQFGFGVSFTPDPAFAAAYATGEQARTKDAGRVVPVFLAVDNLLDADQFVKEGSPLYELASKVAGSRLYPQKDENGVKTIWLQGALDTAGPAKLEKMLKAAGYDGISYTAQLRSTPAPNGAYEKGAEAKTFVVFSPTQIKSAISNTGSFSSEEPNIMFSRFQSEEQTRKEMSQASKDTIKELAAMAGRAVKGDSIALRTAPQWLSVLPLGVVAERFAKRIPLVKEFYSGFSKMTAARNEIVTHAGDTHDAVQAAAQAADPKNGTIKMNTLSALGSFYQVTPWVGLMEQGWVPATGTTEDRIKKAETEWANAGMREATGKTFVQAYRAAAAAFNAFNAPGVTAQENKGIDPSKHSPAQKAYVSMIESLRNIREREMTAMQRRIEESTQNDPDARAWLLGKLHEQQRGLRGAYMPLYRYGDYILRYTDPITGQPAVEYFESDLKRTEEMQKLKSMAAGMQAAGALGKDFTFGFKSTTRSDTPRNLASAPSEMMSKMSDAVLKSYMAKVKPGDEDAANQARSDAQDIVNDMTQIWLRWQPETSALKNAIHRRGVAGFDANMLRGYLKYMQTHGGNVAFLEQGRKIEDTLAGIGADVKGRTDLGVDTSLDQRILNDLRLRYAATKAGSTVGFLASSLSKLGTIKYMTSPSAFLVQMSQLGMLTAPHLAVKYSPGKAMAALTKSVHKAFSPKYSREAMLGDKSVNQVYEMMMATVTPADRSIPEWKGAELGSQKFSKEQQVAAYNKLKTPYQKELLALRLAMAHNVLDISQAHEVAETVQGGDPNSLSSKVMDKAMMFMRHGELGSRKAAVLATFALEQQKGEKFDIHNAIDEIVDVSNKTLFDYSKESKGVAMQGGIARVALQFQHFRLMALSKMVFLAVDSVKGETPAVRKAALKELTAIMGTSGLLAGAQGMVLAPAVFGLLDLVRGLDSPDEPVDSQLEFFNWLQENFGSTVRKGVTHGLPALSPLGVNLSRRIGLGDLVGNPLDAPGNLHGDSLMAYYAYQAGGPSISAIGSFMKGYEDLKEGNTMRGLEAILPKGLTDLVKATRIGTEGLKDRRGNKIDLLDDRAVNPYDLFLIGLGFQPEDVSWASERDTKLKAIMGEISARRGKVIRELVSAIEDGDDLADQIDAVVEFSRANPAQVIKSAEIYAALQRGVKGEMGVKTMPQMVVEQKYGGNY